MTVLLDKTPPPRDCALEFDDVHVTYPVKGRDATVLDGLSLQVARGESYGLVGESGCGKSTAALAAVRYLARGGKIRSGSIRIAGQDVTALDDAGLRQLRANVVSMVFQDPVAALNPTLTVGTQLDEVFRLRGADREAARRASLHALERVRIVDPESVIHRYPHQLSGGMAQRVIIAAALATEPVLLLLDEPTTGLDTTVEADVLELVSDLQAETGTSVMLISHNLAVVAATCDRVGVLYAGQLVEEGPVAEVFAAPQHPYTVGLLGCLPGAGTHKSTTRLATIAGVLPGLGAKTEGCAFADRCELAQDICRTERPPLVDIDGRLAACHFRSKVADMAAGTLQRDDPAAPPIRTGEPLLKVERAQKTFFQSGKPIRALREVNLSIWPGETLGLVGESGSGKSTLARMLLGLLPPDKGATLTLRGDELQTGVDHRSAQAVRDIQIVFQNPAGALNPRHTVAKILGRAVRRLTGLDRAGRRERIGELIDSVRLRPDLLASRPRQLSGGMKQRVAIARAFAGKPALVVCDEPTSALDVSVQAAILNPLSDLQEKDGVSYLLISHDLGVVRYLADRIAVLYLGELMEVGPVDAIFSGPRSPYTSTLLEAIPSLSGPKAKQVRPAAGPAPAATPGGCPFAGRCAHTIEDVCTTQRPPALDAGPDHVIRCHLPLTTLQDLSGARTPVDASALTAGAAGPQLVLEKTSSRPGAAG